MKWIVQSKKLLNKKNPGIKYPGNPGHFETKQNKNLCIIGIEEGEERNTQTIF